MPRRLVYVVNRRTVVDQTTDEAEKLQANAEKAGVPKPVISTLRGQYADNREWSADPSRPAIICGTVDMIGSRLLFSGYGVGFKGKPLHAGFLGQDVLLVHDEAHLEPAFQVLIEAIQQEQQRCHEFGKFRVMELSATSRGKQDTFELTPAEIDAPDQLPTVASEPIHFVWQRLKAKKALHFIPAKRDDVASTVGKIARDRWNDSGKAILVFVHTIADVKAVHDELQRKRKDGPEGLRKGVPDEQIQMLTGTLRGLERDKLAREDPVFARFMHSPKVTPRAGTVYLICTSAGEVGVDISADHMVCDLTTLDSMAQRLGRVNRRGEGAAEIDVVFETDPNPKPNAPEYESARWATKAILDADRRDGSPLALGTLMRGLSEEKRKAAFAPPPTILPTSDILFDAWALTTIKDKLPGRPPVEPYLHGIAEWQPPETQVAWREEVSAIKGDLLDYYKPAELLDDYPLKPHELLRENSNRVFDRLKKLPPETPVWILADGDAVEISTLGKIIAGDKEDLFHKTLLLPPEAGGLSEQGMLDPTSDQATDVADDWYADKERKLRQRVRIWGEDVDPPPGMRRCRPVIDLKPDEDEAEESTEKRYWHWFERIDRAGEGKATANEAYELQRHLDDAEATATSIVDALKLAEPLRSAIIVAAMYHDLGKARTTWQRSIGNFDATMSYAKSGGKMRPRDLNGYRHEFGSLLDVTEHKLFRDLSDEMKELALHLIAAHHGRARPHFPIEEAFDPEPKGRNVDSLTSETPRRFAKLQRKYGRWGLAYLESLVRAADILASQKAEKGGEA